MGRATPKVAVVGAGAWGQNLVRNFHALGALAAVCDLDPEARARAEADYGVPVFADYQRVLDDPSIPAIALATPANTHFGMALSALEAGKDVLVEKPLALEAADGRHLVQRAERDGRVLMVGHVLRFHPAVETASRMLADGVVGRLRHVYSNRLNFGKIHDGKNILWSFAPHDISLILHLVGELPSRVRAEGAAWLTADVADVTVTHLLFANGVRAHIHVSWLHPFKDHRLVIAGERGMLVFDDGKPWAEKLVHYPHAVDWVGKRPVAQRADARPIAVREEEPLRRECAHFLARVADRQTPLTDGREGLAVLRVLQAAHQSLDEDRSVDPTDPQKPAHPRFEGVRIHPSVALEGDDISIGQGTSIWHFSKLLGPVSIGERCSLGQNVVVERNVTLGDNVKVQNNVSIYSGVILEDDVFCGPSMVFTNVGTPRSHYPRRGQYVETRVKRGASIGANATVVCGNTLGRYCFVGAGSVVTKDVPDFGLVYGNPARLRGWACYCGVKLPLAVDEASEQATCSDCDRQYRREGTRVQMIGEG